MRNISIFVSCLTLFGFSIKSLAAQPFLLEEQKSIILAQRINSSVLDRWELAFQEYTSNDGMFSFKIPGSCPLESRGARCGYPKPYFAPVDANSNVKITSIYGGNYEIGFYVQITDYFNRSINAEVQQTFLQREVQSFRKKLENKEGGRLVSTKNIIVNGHKGIDLYWQGIKHQSGLSSTFVRMVVAGNRVYVLNAGTLDRLVPLLNRDISTFLNSLKIIKVSR